MRTSAVGVVLGFLLSSILLLDSGVQASSCSGNGQSGGQWVGVQITCSEPSAADPGVVLHGGGEPVLYLEYRWTSVCATDIDVRPGDLSCAYVMTCPSLDEK